jgi:hypothetical protein
MTVATQVFSTVTPGAPLTVTADDGTTYLHYHASHSGGPITERYEHVARWVAR